jgi:hypothetical protein
MRRVVPVILAGAGLLVGLDIVGAFAGKPLGFPYSYLAVGLLGALRATFVAGAAAAASVGVLDGTLGPLAAWLVGAGPVGQAISETGVFAYGIAVVTATAAAAGTIGALAGVWVERRRALRPRTRPISR